MESVFVRYLRTRLFSQNSLARKASLVRFVKTNSCVNIVRLHFHEEIYIYNWNSHYDGNGLAGQLWQMESALTIKTSRSAGGL